MRSTFRFFSPPSDSAGGPDAAQVEEPDDGHQSAPSGGVFDGLSTRPKELRAADGNVVNLPKSRATIGLPGARRSSDTGDDRPTAERSALIEKMAAGIVLRQDGTFDVPVKLTYAGVSGAQEWIAAAKDPDYVLREAELELVEGFFHELPVRVDEIVEFGPGDGYKAAQITRNLAQRGLHYTAFDASNELLEAAQNTLDALGREHDEFRLELEFHTIDLEDPDAIATAERPPRTDGATVGLLLGQTLGNPSGEARANMLRNIQARLPENGHLLVGVALVPDTRETIEQTLLAYRAESQQRQSLIALEYLGVANAGELSISWDASSNTVVGYFTFDRDVTVAGTALSFKEGHKAQVLNSHRFTKSELVELLTETGFRDIEIATSVSFPYALVSARVSETKGDA